MPAVPTRTFTDLVRGQVAAIQGAAAGLVDFTIGSILRAVVEANAQVILWLQAIALQILAATRASTSSGSDLDSWMADFGLTRLPAVSATGLVTFSRFTATQPATIAVGVTVETADGSQQYAVTLDATNPLYSASAAGYVLPAGLATATVPVAAQLAGSAGNAAVGALNTITQALPGIDTVSNGLAFANGADAESDQALRARFITYIQSLSEGTVQAIGFAIASLGQGITYAIVENQSYAGVALNDYFYVVVDDGTGAPSAAFIARVSAAVDLVRPIGSTFSVYPPVELVVSVTMSVNLKTGYLASVVSAAISTAITSYMDALPLGAGFPLSKLYQLAYDASPGVANVSSVTLNGGVADLAPVGKQVIKAGTVTVSAS